METIIPSIHYLRSPRLCPQRNFGASRAVLARPRVAAASSQPDTRTLKPFNCLQPIKRQVFGALGVAGAAPPRVKFPSSLAN